jgi:hypothetical protein
MMKIGTHANVEIVSCGLGEQGDKKTPFIAIEFENKEGDTMTWQGWLSEGAKERTIKTLISLGFMGKSVADLANPDKGISDLFGEIGAPVSVVVEEEEYEGKKRAKIAWVNIGGIAKFDHQTAVAKVKDLSVDGDLMKYRKEIKAPKPKAENPKKASEGTGEAEGDADVPW